MERSKSFGEKLWDYKCQIIFIIISLAGLILMVSKIKECPTGCTETNCKSAGGLIFDCTCGYFICSTKSLSVTFIVGIVVMIIGLIGVCCSYCCACCRKDESKVVIVQQIPQMPLQQPSQFVQMPLQQPSQLVQNPK
jgi:uncharacterized membrane protein YuzA (DUF378 family)